MTTDLQSGDWPKLPPLNPKTPKRSSISIGLGPSTPKLRASPSGPGLNFEETIVGKLTEVYQTVHLKEFTDFPKKDEKDPTTVFTDIHFKKKSIAHEAYHLSHGYCQ